MASGKTYTSTALPPCKASSGLYVMMALGAGWLVGIVASRMECLKMGLPRLCELRMKH